MRLRRGDHKQRANGGALGLQYSGRQLDPQYLTYRSRAKPEKSPLRAHSRNNFSEGIST